MVVRCAVCGAFLRARYETVVDRISVSGVGRLRHHKEATAVYPCRRCATLAREGVYVKGFLDGFMDGTMGDFWWWPVPYPKPKRNRGPLR